MPRLSADLLAQRRQHILTSAWSCFARTGFHATSMDDVVAATGMSTSAVYRYFSSKEELIDATMDEALALVRDLFTKLLTSEPVPTPHETLRAFTDELHRRSAHPRYDLSQIVIQGWAEALRRPAFGERTRTFYLEAREHLAELARRWIADRQMDADADPDAVSAVLLALMPGLIVTYQLVADFSADTLSSGLAALGYSSRGTPGESAAEKTLR